MSTRRQQQQQQRTTNQREHRQQQQASPFDALNHFCSVGSAVEAVMESAAEEGLSTKNLRLLNIDSNKFNDLVQRGVDQGSENDVESDNEESNGSDYEDDSDDYYGSSNKRASIRDPIKREEGENYKITQMFTFAGTLNDLQEGTAETKVTMSCPDMKNAGHRALVKETEVTFIQNTFPFSVAINLNGLKVTNLQVTQNPKTSQQSCYVIPPNVIQPMCVGDTIFSHGDRDFEVTGFAEKCAYATEQTIKAGIRSPTIEEFVGGEIQPSNAHINQLNEAVKKFKSTGQDFVAKDSLLGQFITDNMPTNRAILPWENKLQSHHILQTKEIESQINAMKEMIEASPVGKMDGVSGSIFKADGTEWTDLPKGIPPAEKEHLLTSTQYVTVKLVSTVQAWAGFE